MLPLGSVAVAVTNVSPAGSVRLSLKLALPEEAGRDRHAGEESLALRHTAR